MQKLDQRLVEALREAADDLGIALVTPFDTAFRTGEPVCVEGYFPDFGDAQGIAVTSFSRRLKLCSLVIPISILTIEYRKYKRRTFMEALRDWGWYGQGDPPDWFNGR